MAKQAMMVAPREGEAISDNSEEIASLVQKDSDYSPCAWATKIQKQEVGLYVQQVFIDSILIFRNPRRCSDNAAR
jgi:hypothetical protein